MKRAWLPIFLLFSGCAAISADPWGWLDDPDERKWVDVKVIGYGREITYSVPDRLRSGGQRPRIWPPPIEGSFGQVIHVPRESLREGALTLAQYLWDRWWGGFHKRSDYDFSLNVRVELHEGDSSLLDKSTDELLGRPLEYRKKIYSKPNPTTQKIGEYFFERYWVKPFESKTGHVWVSENNPIVTADHVYYTIPITDHHILEFSFFVRDKRYDWKDDPEWNARRWALVEQIMNTVRITPNPFPGTFEPAAKSPTQ